MTRKLLLVALLVVALLVTPALAATISAHSTTAYVGQAPKEVNIVLDSAPAGHSGYDITVSVSDPALATIAAATNPGGPRRTVGVTRQPPSDHRRPQRPDPVRAPILLGTVAVRADAGTVDHHHRQRARRRHWHPDRGHNPPAQSPCSAAPAQNHRPDPHSR